MDTIPLPTGPDYTQAIQRHNGSPRKAGQGPMSSPTRGHPAKRARMRLQGRAALACGKPHPRLVRPFQGPCLRLWPSCRQGSLCLRLAKQSSSRPWAGLTARLRFAIVLARTPRRQVVDGRNDRPSLERRPRPLVANELRARQGSLVVRLSADGGRVVCPACGGTLRWMFAAGNRRP